MARAFDDEAPQPAGDVLHEACGVAGIYARGTDVARLTYFGLYALQHRGQESAGIAVADGERIVCHREMGLISSIFDEETLGGLRGHLSVGHTRYSTSGSSVVVNAQPLIENSPVGTFALAHNGNLTNTDELRGLLQTTISDDASDTEVLARLIAEAPEDTMTGRIRRVMHLAIGAYSIVLATRDALYAFRDPWGVRPIGLGTYGDGYMIASESCALSTVGAKYLREIEAGEIVTIDDSGLRSEFVDISRPQALCMFEYIYFARPDSLLAGRSLYMSRYEMGRSLAREHPIDADVVMAVPDSAIPGGIGYAAESGLPYVEGLIKNRYIGRTFISPDQQLRAEGVHPCYLGVDMATYDELIAANLTVDQICERVGADSLGYLSTANLVAATGRERANFCLGCLTGEYPMQAAVSTPGADRQPALHE